jgi:hypothetical protein
VNSTERDAFRRDSGVKVAEARERALEALRIWAKVQFPGNRESGLWAYENAKGELLEASKALLDAEAGR